jgi:hypothetical protein
MTLEELLKEVFPDIYECVLEKFREFSPGTETIEDLKLLIESRFWEEFKLDVLFKVKIEKSLKEKLESFKLHFLMHTVVYIKKWKANYSLLVEKSLMQALKKAKNDKKDLELVNCLLFLLNLKKGCFVYSVPNNFSKHIRLF